MSLAAHQLATLLETIVKSLIDNPDQGRVETMWSNDRIALTVDVAPSDQGKVIGQNGRTARAIRTIIGAAAKPHGIVCTVEIRESGRTF